MKITIDDMEEEADKVMLALDPNELSGNFYRRRLEKKSLFSACDRLIINYIKNNFDIKKDAIFEPGCGIGQLSLALGVFGFKTEGLECDRKRYNSAVKIKSAFDKKFGKSRTSFVKGTYPELAPNAELLVSNNFAASYIKVNEDKVLKSFIKYPNLIFNIKMFGFPRNDVEQKDLMDKLIALGFVPSLIHKTIYLLEK